MKYKKERCVVCGAKIRWDRFSANTCDPLCTRAKHAGRTRYEQALEEPIRESNEFWDLPPYGCPSYDPDIIPTQQEDEKQGLGD